jgi:bisphosphoglycerate-independent phosphoglycerate mutase (AlkP superfamily)
VGRSVTGVHLHDGVLADVAPTICALTGLPRWDGMAGRPLIDGAGVWSEIETEVSPD